MESVVRTPQFEVRIVRPNYESATYTEHTVVGEFGSNDENNAVIGYEFKESLSATGGEFNLSLTVETDDLGRTWKDLIYLRDVVFISEFGEIRFVGVVGSRRISSRMAGEGPERRVVVSGYSISGLLSTFKIVIDQFLYVGTTTAEAANKKLKAKLVQAMDDGAPVRFIMKAIYDEFFEFALKMGDVNPQGLGIKAILDNFVGFDAELSEEVVLHYPLALSLYNVGENNVWDILLGILTPPVFELFMRWDPSTSLYQGVFRQSPFQPEHWRALPIHRIPAVYITDHDFGNSDQEIYTYYLCLVAGAGISDKKGMILDATEHAGYGGLASRDDTKWRKYGYRPLIVEFKYFDTSQKETYTEVGETMRGLGAMLKTWYEHNDEFESGSLSFMTIDNRQKDLTNPRIGERLGLLSGEFYIEEVQHTWQYGGPMETKLSLSRGFVYDSNGALKEPIKDLGKKLLGIRTIDALTEG